MLQWFPSPRNRCCNFVAGYVSGMASGTEPAKGILADAPGRVKAGNCFLRFFLEHFFLAPGPVWDWPVSFWQEWEHSIRDNRGGGGILEERRLFLLCYLSGTAAALLLSGADP